MHERTQESECYDLCLKLRQDRFVHNLHLQSILAEVTLIRHKQMKKDGRFTKDYPKRLIGETQSEEDSYPKYRRRAPDDDDDDDDDDNDDYGFSSTIQRGNQGEITVDDQWVVSYSPLLCKIFNVHTNVEYCNSIKSIKYVCKYINK